MTEPERSAKLLEFVLDLIPEYDWIVEPETSVHDLWAIPALEGGVEARLGFTPMTSEMERALYSAKSVYKKSRRAARKEMKDTLREAAQALQAPPEPIEPEETPQLQIIWENARDLEVPIMIAILDEKLEECAMVCFTDDPALAESLEQLFGKRADVRIRADLIDDDEQEGDQ